MVDGRGSLENNRLSLFQLCRFDIGCRRKLQNSGKIAGHESLARGAGWVGSSRRRRPAGGVILIGRDQNRIPTPATAWGSSATITLNCP
jgi:hypothetical protein